MLRKLRIVTLSENTVGASPLHRPGVLQGEWGLSILAETEEGNILLDCGNGDAVVRNAGTLGIDLSRIDKLVLSHSHLDHTGGLRDFLRHRNREIEIIAHPEVFALSYASINRQPARFVGIPFRRETLEDLGARFNLTAEPVRISENIWTTGQVPLRTDFEKADSACLRKEGTEMLPDGVEDDRSLVLRTEYGLVVLLGCAHRGVINHLLHAQEITGVKEVHTVIGGCHLVGAKTEQVEKTVASLQELHIKKLGVSHCTGLAGAFAMMQAFGNRFFANNAGTIIDIPEEND